MRDPLIRRTGFLFVAAVQAVLILVVGGGYLGCSRHESGEGAALESSGTDAEIAQPRGDFPIVLISIDTLRSDHLPVYGYDAVDTPHIDRLRQDSILFEHVYSPYPLTLPAHVSLLTGLLPPEHGVRDNSGYRLDTSQLVYLPLLLKQKGYATGAAVSSYVLRATTGLATGFDLYEDRVEFRTRSILGEVQRSGGETLESIIPWLRSVVDRPFFLFFHIYEPHTPHNPPEPFASRYESPYDGEVALADTIVGGLTAELHRLGVYDSSTIILTSDHGEGLNDHDDYEHGLLLYREALQVPLIVKLPNARLAGSTVSRPAQLIDVFPTILDLIAHSEPITLPGRSLLDTDSDSSDSTASIYAETYFPLLHFGWSELRSSIAFPFHYIEGPDPELYNLETDPLETQNILRDNRRVFGRLREELKSYDAAFIPPSEVDQESRDKLAALGYLGSIGGSSEGPLPDPKTQLYVLDALKRATDDYSSGRYQAAVDGFRGVLAEQPRLIDAWEQLGQSLMALGRVLEAREAFETGFEVSGGSPHFATELAGIMMKLNRLDEARKFAEIAAEAQDLALDLLAQIAIRQGDLTAAQHYVDRAVSTRGTRIGPLITKAELSFLQNRLDDVIKITFEVEELAREGDKIQQLQGLFFLQGSAYARLGQGEKAVESYRREIELFPAEIAAYSRLAILYDLLGRPDEAERTIQELLETNPVPPAFAEATRAFQAINMDRQATALLRDALRRWPADPELQSLAGSG